MKKFRIFALLVMLGSFFFLFNEQNSARSITNYCLLPGEFCTVQGSCCTKICCLENDSRWQCEGQPVNTCG